MNLPGASPTGRGTREDPHLLRPNGQRRCRVDGGLEELFFVADVAHRELPHDDGGIGQERERGRVLVRFGAGRQLELGGRAVAGSGMVRERRATCVSRTSRAFASPMHHGSGNAAIGGPIGDFTEQHIGLAWPQEAGLGTDTAAASPSGAASLGP